MQVYIDRLKVLLSEASQDPQSPAQRELHDLIVMRVGFPNLGFYFSAVVNGYLVQT